MLPRFIPLANRFGDRFFIEVLPTLSKTASDHLDQAWHRASRDSDQAAVDSSNTAQMGTRMSLLDGMLVQNQGGRAMRQMTKNTVEHVVETTSRSYEQVKASLETQMNVLGNTDELMKQLVAAKASWDQVRETIEKRIGPSGFTIFGKVEQGQLLSLAGKPRRVIQYAVGNPFLAIQMIEHAPEIALYAPIRLAVYEAEDGKTCISYDRFTSVVAQYPHPEVARVAKQVEQKLEDLVTQAVLDPKHDEGLPGRR